MGKGKVQYIEVLSENEDSGEDKTLIIGRVTRAGALILQSWHSYKMVSIR